ncbi:autophagy protein 6 [Xylographa opegraphella]|nr:autophagy protein 6 [Xylographa opegraphella]
MNCQRCRVPLRLDPSLQDLNPAAFDLLVGSSTQPHRKSTALSRPLYPSERNEKLQKALQNAAPPLFKGTASDLRQSTAVHNSDTPGRTSAVDNPAMSFVMLTESQVHPPPAIASNRKNSSVKAPVKQPASMSSALSEVPHQSLSNGIDSASRLFEILSSRSDIDHPICAECTEILLASMEARLAASIKERDAYTAFLKELKNSIPSESEVAKAEAELIIVNEKQEKALIELKALEEERDILSDEVAELEAESRALDREEEEFWRSRNAFALRLSTLRDTSDALQAAYLHDSQQLERLQRTNVYNDTFCIGHDGNFGTINGLRLGRLAPPNNIEWAEINAAWGTTALLLATVADRLGFQFRGYRIKPMGSSSYIERIEYPNTNSVAGSTTSTRIPSGPFPNTSPRTQQPKITALELYSSGDLPLGRTILHRRFNDAMVAFLECLRQLGDFVENGESQTARGQQAGGLKLPYKIDKDKIHGVSIKLGISQDEAWTHACKYTLTCCKFLLAHASNVAGVGGGTRRNAG